MKTKYEPHKVVRTILATALIAFSFVALTTTASVIADDTTQHCREQHPDDQEAYELCGRNIQGSGGFPEFTQPEDPEGLVNCGNVMVSIDVGCDENTDNPILAYLAGIINFLAGGVFIVVMIMLAVAGVEYITAHGAPQKIEDAKRRITNAIIALITFIFMYAILQWLIPGGIFGGDSPPPAGDTDCNPAIEECLN